MIYNEYYDMIKQYNIKITNVYLNQESNTSLDIEYDSIKKSDTKMLLISIIAFMMHTVYQLTA